MEISLVVVLIGFASLLYAKVPVNKAADTKTAGEDLFHFDWFV